MNARRFALVTGAGRHRIGWHVVQALADRGFGIGVHYHTSRVEAEATVAELDQRGIAAASFAADLRDENSVDRLLDQFVECFGRIDALVHGAGQWQARRLEEVTAADVRSHFDVNLLSTFLCAQRAGLRMVAQPQGGVIVTVGDWATIRPYVNYSAYFVSKGAIPTLTRCLAVELAQRNPNVRVNCILPGPVMLPDDMTAAQRAQIAQSTLVRREGSPQHVAQAVLHLIDNDFLTGVCLPVDGGRSVFAPDSYQA